MAYSKNRRLAEIVSDTSGNLSVEGIIVPTQSNSDNDTSAASTAFVHAHIDAVLDSAPGTLNTLNEIAAALNDDANFNTTVSNAIAGKLPLAGGTMTGNIAHASDFTLDVAGNIILDADGGTVELKDGGTSFGSLFKSSSNMIIYSSISNGDMKFQGNDGGANITALQLDMSASGRATFNNNVVVTDNNSLIAGSGDDLQIYYNGTNGEIDVSSGNLTLDVAGGITLDADGGQVDFKDGGTLKALIDFTGNNVEIQSRVTDGDLLFRGQDGSSFITALTLDMSDAGTAIFNHDVKLGDNGKAIFGAGEDATIFSDGTSGYMRGFILQNKAGNKDVLTFADGGATTLFHNNVAKLATTATGIDVTGYADADNFKIAGAQGSDGQVLTSTGSGVAWEAVPAGGATSLNGLSDATVTGSNPATNTNPSSGVGTLWINSSSGQSYVCTDATSNNNVWTNITEGASIQATLDVDYLVIAGGGAGGRGNNAAGGGGAGGYRSSFNSETSGGGASSETLLQLTAGTVYTITVGAGGAQSSIAGNHIGNSGAASSITGSDITNVTTVGGGGGAASTGNALGGGSGGGGAWTAKPGGSGTANQGFKGGDAFAASNQWSGAGGGGAGAAGANVSVGSNSAPTDGGVGLASSITGSSIYRAGGGGGSADAGSGSSGGNGGGGAGGKGTALAHGTANTGSGGGAMGSNTPGAGGSGVVILRMFTSSYTGTTAGSPTVTQSGNKTILTYTSSGTYTG